MVREFEKNLITSTLKKTDWNQKKAAHLLRVKATTLNEKLKRLDIKDPERASLRKPSKDRAGLGQQIVGVEVAVVSLFASLLFCSGFDTFPNLSNLTVC